MTLKFYLKVLAHWQENTKIIYSGNIVFKLITYQFIKITKYFSTTGVPDFEQKVVNSRSNEQEKITP